MNYMSAGESLQRVMADKYAFISWRSYLALAVAENYTSASATPLVHLSANTFSHEVSIDTHTKLNSMRVLVMNTDSLKILIDDRVVVECQDGLPFFIFLSISNYVQRKVRYTCLRQTCFLN